MNKEKELIDKLIDLAFAEDIGDGDHTTLSCIPATAMGKSKLLIKEAGVLFGSFLCGKNVGTDFLFGCTFGSHDIGIIFASEEERNNFF